MMFARTYRRLERLLADLRKHPPDRRTRPATRTYLALEALEDRLTPSHPALVPHAAAPSPIAIGHHTAAALAPHEPIMSHTSSAVPHHTAAAVSGHEQPTSHTSPANEAERLALLKQLQSNAHKAAPHPAPPAKPAPSHPAPAHPAPPRQNAPAPTPGPGGPIRIEPYPPVVPPTPSPPRPVVPPIGGGYGFGPNPTTYIPEYCTTATFSGNMGPDGHYTSFTIVGYNSATGTRVIISYILGTPYGAPVYHWAVTVDSPTLGNWGNECTVNEPYYMDFLPLPVSYNQPGYGP